MFHLSWEFLHLSIRKSNRREVDSFMGRKKNPKVELTDLEEVRNRVKEIKNRKKEIYRRLTNQSKKKG
jgi:hypothetical protein